MSLTYLGGSAGGTTTTTTGGPTTADELPFTPDGTIAATDTQAAIEEVRDEAAALTHDHTAAGSGGQLNTGALVAGAVTYAKIQNVSATNRFLGRDTVGAGVIEEIDATAALAILGVEAGSVAPPFTTGDYADDSVTYAKLQDVSATDRFLGRDTAGAGVVEEIAPAAARTILNVEDGANAPPFVTADYTDDSVTYAKIQDVTATSRVLGRITAGSGIVEELTAANVKTILALTTTDISDASTVPGSTATAALDYLFLANGLPGPWSSARRYPTSSVTSTSIVSTSGGSSTIAYTQFYVPSDYTLGSIYFEVTSNSGTTASSTARAGIYEDAGGTPGDLLFDSGALSITTTGVKSASTSSLAITAGHYWFAFRCNTGTALFRGMAASVVAPWLGEPAAAATMGTTPYTQRLETGAYGAFPATATAAAATSAALILVEVGRA